MNRFGPKRFTDQQWKDVVAVLGNGEFETISTYEHNQLPVQLRHSCGFVFSKKPNDFKRRPTCPTCHPPGRKAVKSSGVAYTREHAQTILDREQGGEFTIGADYTIFSQACTITHRVCGHSWLAAPYTLTRGRAKSYCPNCRTNKWTTEIFRQKVAESFEGDQYEVVGEYTGSNVPVRMRHAGCGHEWEVSPNNFLNGHTRCPVCSKPRNSKYARKVAEALSEMLDGFQVLREHTFKGDDAPKSIAGYPLIFDFWIPDLHFLIEVDGELHDLPWRDSHGRSKLERAQANDRIKDEWARSTGKVLHRIHYKDKGWEDVLYAALLKAAP